MTAPLMDLGLHQPARSLLNFQLMCGFAGIWKKLSFLLLRAIPAEAQKPVVYRETILLR